MKYESSIPSGLIVMAKVKLVFVHATDVDTDTRAMPLAPRTFVLAGLIKLEISISWILKDKNLHSHTHADADTRAMTLAPRTFVPAR